MVPFPWLSEITPEMEKILKEDMDRRIREGMEYKQKIVSDFVKRAVPLDQMITTKGPFHAASILAWTTIAKHANVPYIPAELISTIPIKDAWAYVDRQPLSKEGVLGVQLAEDYTNAGGFWRTDVCASEEVKYVMGSKKGLPDIIPFTLDDCRIMDLHDFLPEIKIIGRPRMTPQYLNGYPIEFRVFIKGQAPDEGAVSFYYPQAGRFDVTSVLQKAMDQSLLSAQTLWNSVTSFGLIPWLPQQGEPDIKRGCSLDFMLLTSGHITLVDAGPGLGSGAHPCCFLDVEEVKGQKWHVDDGVEIR